MAECIGEYRGYKLFLPTSGGKAGKGKNKTTSLQIRNGNMVVAQFRFKTGTPIQDITHKARKIIDERRREIRMMS